MITSRTTFFLLFAAVLAFATSEMVSPETELMESENIYRAAKESLDVLLQEGKSDSACRNLASNSKKEIETGRKNNQALLDRMDVGKNCHKAGLEAVNAAQKREKKAGKTASSARNACNKARNAKVTVATKTLAQFKVGCAAFLNDRAYIKAKGHMSRTCKDATKKEAAHRDAKKATKSAKQAHQKAKVTCACRAQKNHKTAVKVGKSFNSAANQRAWTKSYHMMCVLDGKSASRCKVPRVPRVSVPSMPSWVARQSCKNGKANDKSQEKKGKENKNKHGHRERTNKNNEKKGKENKNKHHKNNEKKGKESKHKNAHRERTNKANERKHKKSNTCKGGVYIYQHYHFKGYSRHFPMGRYDMHAMQRRGVKNDDASSAKVTKGCRLIIYQHSRFNGKHATYDCDSKGWGCAFDHQYFTRRGVKNDQMSSLRVCNRDGSGC